MTSNSRALLIKKLTLPCQEPLGILLLSRSALYPFIIKYKYFFEQTVPFLKLDQKHKKGIKSAYSKLNNEILVWASGIFLKTIDNPTDYVDWQFKKAYKFLIGTVWLKARNDSFLFH